MLDPWRIRYRLELAGELEPAVDRRSQRETPSERLLWAALEPEPHGWFREYVTGPYRLDFYCPAARLAVEVDGGSHLGRVAGERDALRDEWHKLRGITTMRVAAAHVERDVAGVVDEVRRRVQALLGEVPAAAASLASDAHTQEHQAGDAVGDLADGPLGQAETLRAALEEHVDVTAEAVDGAHAQPLLGPDPVVEQSRSQDVVSDQAGLVAAQVRLVLLMAELGDSDSTPERTAERVIAQACRTVLPAQREAFVAQVLQRAGLRRRRNDGIQ